MPEHVGRYLVFSPFSSGGMATVHLARFLGPLGFRRTLAAKKLRPELVNAEMALTLVDEARLCARVQHPNVVQVVDVVNEGAQPVIFMDHVLGSSLSCLLRKAERAGMVIDVPIARAIGVGILSGLHAAHLATDEAGAPLGIVHRDVSPQNILVGVDGIARVADFGIAKASGRAQSTREGQIKGKLAYMAPEQMRGEAVDARTDVFAAGIVLWEMLVGRRLFAGEDEKTIIGRVLVADVPPPSHGRPGLPQALDAVMGTALRREPERRFETARAFADALRAGGPLASAEEVGAWVEGLCGDEITARRRAVAAVESAGAGASAEDMLAPLGEGGAEQTASLNLAAEEGGAIARLQERPRQVPPARAAWWFGSVFLAAAATVALVSTGAAAPPAQPPMAAAMPDFSFAPPPEAPPASAPTVTSSPEVPPAASPEPSAATLAPRQPARPRPSSSAPDCKPPWVLDEHGRKRYRRDCLRE